MLHFWTEGVQRGAKAMTDVRKPGGYGKVVSVLFFSPYSIAHSNGLSQHFTPIF